MAHTEKLTAEQQQVADEKRLAELGYKQELSRTWSGFSNFAISFSIISILAGCFTIFAVGWNNGGPAAIAIGWPTVALLILIVGFCMSELVSAYPTSGGIYWWASKLGGAKAGFFTGWLNLIGLIAIEASVAYGCATFTDLTLGVYSESWAEGYSLTRTFGIFIVVLILVSLVNIFSSHLLAVFNNISVWWHVAGATFIVGILLFVPNDHQSVGDVFSTTVNNTGFFGGSTTALGFFLCIIPLSFILAQYTITGYDASAHLSEETHDAADAAAKGIWRSIFYSGLGGWILLLAVLFAVQDVDVVTEGGGAVATIFTEALSTNWATTILAISAIAQFFCTVACMTSATRMIFAFSRDGAVPGHRHWRKLNSAKVPFNAVILVAVCALIVTSPALVEVDINGAPVPVAFFAVTTIGVVGLYVSFAIPIYYRWRMGDAFPQGSWNLGTKWKWMAPVAIAEIAITSFIALMPGSPAAIPWNDDFALKYMNYTPIVVGGALILLWLYWTLSAKNWFTGPKTTIDLPEGEVDAVGT